MKRFLVAFLRRKLSYEGKYINKEYGKWKKGSIHCSLNHWQINFKNSLLNNKFRNPTIQILFMKFLTYVLTVILFGVVCTEKVNCVTLIIAGEFCMRLWQSCFKIIVNNQERPQVSSKVGGSSPTHYFNRLIFLSFVNNDNAILWCDISIY